MAQDIFLKLTGINGESQDSSHKNEIDVLSWHWGVSQNSSMSSGSGGGSGKATVEDLCFVHNIDCASPNLMQYSLTGKPITQGVLTMRKAGGTPLEYLTITMNQVLVTSCKPSGCSSTGSTSSSSSGTASSDTTETVTLSFATVTQQYTTQNPQGGSGGAVTASYDIKGNKES